LTEISGCGDRVADDTEGQDTGPESSGAGVEPAASASPTSGDQVSALWRRLKEHRIAQWAIGYVAVAYGIQHAVVLTTESLDWPHVVTRVSMLLLALGLPMAITLAWYHGERVNRRISGPELTIISILLVGISLLFYEFIRPSEQIVARQDVVAPVTTAIAPVVQPAGTSIAVLPFLNLSGDPKEEYFSDGMTEEITSALARVKGLNVVARTSAFQFKGENRDMRAVGQALGATDLIEGSVRQDGNQVRITAQLIKAADGTHLWTESYDRELKGVFAVQEDIAQAIAGALQIPLGLKPGEHLVSARTNNTRSYQDYLRARAIFRARDLAQTIPILEQAVASDPSYAPSWALLAQTYNITPVFTLSLYDGPIERVSVRYRSYADKAERAAQHALSIDPRNAAAHAALAQAAALRLDWPTADDQFRQALALDPDDPDILNIYSYSFLVPVGYLKQALAVREKLLRLEPFVPVYNILTAQVLLTQGQSKSAIDLLQATPTGGPTGYIRNSWLTFALADAGRYRDAADALLATPPTPIESRTVIEDAARYLRSAPAAAVSRDDLPAFEMFSLVYLFTGAPNRYFDYFERNIAVVGSVKNAVADSWNPILAPLRKTERFKELMHEAKLVDFWRTHSWPDLCHPVGAEDFACN
jgi:TolB-like protein/Tfp pilus assembly protein PilF